MTATITQVRDGIKVRLATISGLETFARTPPGGTEPPLAVVSPAPERFLTYDRAMNDSSDNAVFLIKVAVAGVESDDAETLLDAYLARSGSKSIRAAVAADRRLGSIVSYAEVTDGLSYGTIAIGGIQYFGAELLVTVAM